MAKLKVGLNDNQRKKICGFLSKFLASTYMLYLKTHNYHWNIKGKEFYSMHLLFEKQYEELAQVVDEIAERIRILGHNTQASFEAFSKDSIIKSEKGFPKAKEMVKRLLDDHEKIICFLRDNLSYIEEVHDGATADLINQRLTKHEKIAWMFRSLLEG